MKCFENRIWSCVGILLMLLSIISCKREIEKNDEKRSDVIIRFGDSELTVTDVLSRMPAGLDPTDSLEMFRTLADNWLSDRLLEDIAFAHIGDDVRIEKMVQDYRRRLLVNEYRRRFKSTTTEKSVKEDSVRAYYERHKEDYILDRPVVKGVFLKMPANADRLDDAKTWMAQADQKSIDRLEKHALGDALQYEYFNDDWQDWEALRNQIPYHFPDADIFLKNNKNFVTSYGNNVYILHISDYLPSGAIMPYSIAANQIRGALADAARENSEKKMMGNLINKALKDGRLEFPHNTINSYQTSLIEK